MSETNVDSTAFCAVLSESAGEPLAGTAPEVSTWFIVEHQEPWARKQLPAPGFSAAVNQTLEQWTTRIPKSRVQLIRGGAGQKSGSDTPDVTAKPQDRKLFVAHTAGESPWILAFSIGDDRDIVELDIETVIATGSHPGAIRRTAPMVLVCTHGKRDRCCAKRGLPVYQTLIAESADGVWQTSHLGGHRFATTCLVLPHGYLFGRVDSVDVATLWARYIDGMLENTELLRGRTALSPQEQAAEIWLRNHDGIHDVSGFSSISSEEIPCRSQRAKRSWRIELSRGEDVPITLHVDYIETANATPGSCGEKPSPIAVYRCTKPTIEDPKK